MWVCGEEGEEVCDSNEVIKPKVLNLNIRDTVSEFSSVYNFFNSL